MAAIAFLEESKGRNPAPTLQQSLLASEAKHRQRMMQHQYGSQAVPIHLQCRKRVRKSPETDQHFEKFQTIWRSTVRRPRHGIEYDSMRLGGREDIARRTNT